MIGWPARGKCLQGSTAGSNASPMVLRRGSQIKEGVVQKVLIFRDWASNAKIQGQYSGLSQWEPNAAYTRPLYRARPAEQHRYVKA